MGVSVGLPVDRVWNGGSDLQAGVEIYYWEHTEFWLISSSPEARKQHDKLTLKWKHPSNTKKTKRVVAMRKEAEVANHSSKYKEEKKKRKGKTKEDKRPQNHKMRKTVKNKHKRKKKTSLHIHIRKQKHRTLKNSLTVHRTHTQNVHSTHLNPGFLAVQPAKAGAQKRTRHKHKQTKRTHSRHATHNTPVNRTCPRVLTFRVALCCSCSTSAQTHTHTESQSSCKKKTRDEEAKHGEDKAGMQQSTHLNVRPVAHHTCSSVCRLWLSPSFTALQSRSENPRATQKVREKNTTHKRTKIRKYLTYARPDLHQSGLGVLGHRVLN